MLSRYLLLALPSLSLDVPSTDDDRFKNKSTMPSSMLMLMTLLALSTRRFLLLDLPSSHPPLLTSAPPSSPLSQVREAQLNQYNFILVVGEQEASAGTVNVRTRDNEVKGVVPVTELIAQFAEMERSKI
jgi:hypothetical protein